MIELEDKLRTIRCPNEPDDKEGLILVPERHEAFTRAFRVTLTGSYLSNGRQWGCDNPAATMTDVEPVGHVVCATCGAEAEVGPYNG